MIDEIEQVKELAESKWAAGFAEGETGAKTAAILAILTARGIPVSAEARTHIEACREIAILDRWIARAATAASADDVIAAVEERD